MNKKKYTFLGVKKKCVEILRKLTYAGFKLILYQMFIAKKLNYFSSVSSKN
jgi:hypothetical protein